MIGSFPKLDGPRVFIAAPGDLEDLRGAVIGEFEAIFGRSREDREVDVYDFRYAIGEDGFKDWIPAQGQIPLPQGRDCRALICLLGERLGTALPDDFDTSPLGPLEEICGSGSMLIPRWQSGAEKNGGFSLTGTVFECLVALRANTLAAERGENIQSGSPPVLVLVVGERAMLDEEDAFLAGWGGRRHWQAVRTYFERKDPRRGPSDFRRWEVKHYLPQLEQLANFVRYLHGRQPTLQFVPDEASALQRVRTFLKKVLGSAVRREDRDPFKGLEIYREDDHAVFYGRENDRREALKKLARLWDEPIRFFGILGGSGSGKSSFARAGIVGRLCHQRAGGRYVACVVSPSDLLAAALDQGVATNGSSMLLRLLRICLEKIQAARQTLVSEGDNTTSEVNFASARSTLERVPLAKQPERMIGLLESHLRLCLSSDWRLLLTFDQFEELIDQYVQEDSRPLWSPIVELIRLAATHPAMAVVYTLQTNRSDLLANDALLGPLYSAAVHPLAFPGEEGLREIITRPFEVAAGISLEPELVADLHDQILAFARSGQGEARDSLLPLISLTLRRIFDATSSTALARAESLVHGADEAEGAAAAFGRVSTTGPVLRLDDCKGMTDVSGAIGALADEAVGAARQASGVGWSDDAIGALLRRQVRLGGLNYDRPELRLAPARAGGPGKHLIDELAKRRLVLLDPSGRSRLVHEAVLRHWPAASNWLQEQRQLLVIAGRLRSRAEEWVAAGRTELSESAVGERDVDEAAELLVKWFEEIGPIAPTDAEASLLRDYAMALLRARPTPFREVGAAEEKPRHVHVAASYGDLALLNLYLEREPACPSSERGDRRTPIFGAAASGWRHVVDRLLDSGAQPDKPDQKGWQPIHLAANCGHWHVVQRLLEAGVSPNARGGPWSTTALHTAATNGHARVAEGLMNVPGCDPGIAGTYGWLALHLAARYGYESVVRQLLTDGRAAVDGTLENDWTALHLAASFGQAAVIRTLIEFKARVDLRAKNDWSSQQERAGRSADKAWMQLDWTALHLAAKDGHEAAVRELLHAGADADACTDLNRTPLMLAVERGDTPTIRLLLEHRQNLEHRNGDRQTALHMALLADRLDIAGWLLDAGADVDAPLADLTPLHDAVERDSESLVAFLLGRGASEHARGTGGRTPLHRACAAGRLAIAERLVDAGADPDLPDDADQTALHLAAEAGHDAVVAWLLRRPEVNAGSVDRDGMAALHLAAQAGRLRPAQELLRRLSTPDPRDADGWTPLMLAAQAGHVAVAQALLDARADASARADRPSVCALQAAAESGQVEVIDALLAGQVNDDSRALALARAVRNAQFGAAHRLLDAAAPTSSAALALAAGLVESLRGRASLSLQDGDDGLRLLARLRAACSDPAAPSAPPCSDTEGLERLRDEVLGVASPQAQPQLDTDSRRAGISSMAANDPLMRGPVHYPWTALPATDAEALHRRLGPTTGNWPIDSQGTHFEQVRLPWYDNMLLVKLTDARWAPRLALYFMGVSDQPDQPLHSLTGSSGAIHLLNSSAPITLTEGGVLGYLRFFCFFVRASEGPFYILESLDDPLLAPALTEDLLSVLRDTVRPATLEGQDGAGNHLCTALVWYSNALFLTRFRVHPEGTVEMISDEPVAGELSIRIDAPLA